MYICIVEVADSCELLVCLSTDHFVLVDKNQ
jgi:hypothetical protein